MSDFVNLNIMTHYSNADTLQMRPNRSASKPEDYIEELSDHKAIAFTENNNVYNWYSKKKLCDENGIKYIHGVTLNVVQSLEKESSVHHILLLAKNYEGVKEINELVGDSFEGRNNKDGELHHFYFVPRTSIDELRNVSDNVIMIVSGLNNPLWWTKRGNFNEENQLWLDFFEERKANVWLGMSSNTGSNEHMFANEYMKKLGFKMVLVNNIMSHKPEHEYLRYLLNKSQTQRYEENKEYLALKDYSEIVKGFKEQGTFNQDEVDELINETNVISDMIEEFEMDERLKYPQIFANPKQKIRELVNKGFVERGLDKLPPEELKVYVKQANHELEVMEKTQSIDYMLLEQYYKEEMRKQGVYHAPARGCTTQDTLVYTQEGLKNINNIEIGENVYTHDGSLQVVENTMSYPTDTNEEMYNIKTFYSNKTGETYTGNHLLLAAKKDNISNHKWVRADELTKNHYLVFPKFKASESVFNTVDLNKYNDAYDYDDHYIYYNRNVNKKVPHSVRDIAKKLDMSRSVVERLRDGLNIKDGNRLKLEIYLEEHFHSVDEWRDYLNKNTRVIHKLNRFIPVDEDFCYLLGLLTGDGWIAKSKNNVVGAAFNTSENHEYYVDFVKNIFGDDVNVGKNIHKTKNVVQYYIYNPMFYNFLKEFWCNYDYTAQSKQFSDNVMLLPVELKESLLRGYIDADGSVREDGRVTITSVSKKLISQYKIMLSELGIPTGLMYRKKHFNPDSLVEKNNDSWQVMFSLKTINNDSRENRTIINNDFIYKKINSIKKVKGIKNVYDIRVKNNHSYVTNMSAVHNSSGGSVVAYLLQIIDIDPIKEGLIFERFMNEARISLADIDSDWSGEDRRTVQQFLLEHDDLYSAAIITYGTLGIKGAVKDVARALGTYSAVEANSITKEIKNIQGKDIVPSKLRDEHKLLFEYAESLLGIITNVGRHASAILVSDRDIFKEIGYVRVRDFDYPVTAWDMGIVEENKYVKLDILGVKVVEWVNKAVELANLPRITPQSDAIDFNDWDIREDILNNGTATIFQLEEQEEATQQMLSPSSIKKVREYNPNIRLVELLSIITAVIRPGSDSIKDDVLEGNYHDYGVPEINDLLKDSFGHIIYQEQTIALIQYAGFSASEADVIRRAISKKNSDTINNWIPQFKETLIDKITTDYPEKNHDDVANMVDGLAQIIIDSSHYSFNKSHAIAYSYISMQTAWLRYHYPIEWITAGFIVWSDGSNLDKIKTLTKLAKSYNISIEPARFGKSRGEYFFDKELNTIYEGTAPIKGLNKDVGDFLYTYKNNQYDYFLDFLMDITDPFVIKKAETEEIMYRGVDVLNLSEEEVKEVDKAIKSGDLVVESLPTTTPNSAQMLALIRLDYFQSFGGSSYLEEVYQLYKKKYNKTNKTMKSKRKNYQNVKEYEETLDNESDISFYDKANYEIKYLERCTIHDENIPSKYAIVVDIKGKNNYNVNATIRSINKGANIDIRIKSSLFRKVPIEPGDIIQIDSANKSSKNVKVDGSWVKSKTEFDNWVNDMKFIRKGIVYEK